MNITGSTVNIGEIDVFGTGGGCEFNLTGSHLTTGYIFVDGSQFENNPIGGIPGTPPHPVMTIDGGTVNASATILAQSSTLNISSATVTCDTLAAGIQGQINISSGTITATDAIDSVNPFGSSTINVTGGVLNAQQLGITGLYDDVIGPTTSMNISGGQVNVRGAVDER